MHLELFGGKIYISLDCQLLSFFDKLHKYNWYNITFIECSFEYDKLCNGIEFAFALLGFTSTIRYNFQNDVDILEKLSKETDAIEDERVLIKFNGKDSEGNTKLTDVYGDDIFNSEQEVLLSILQYHLLTGKQIEQFMDVIAPGSVYELRFKNESENPTDIELVLVENN